MDNNQASQGGLKPVLKFDHNVIEHLGIKLYQNKLMSVLAELVANSWDADAPRVTLTANQELIGVSDTGVGMNYGRESWTTIWLSARSSERRRVNAPFGNRLPMGRKGIGKLAPFGDDRKVDVVTASDGKVNWFTLDVDAMLQKGPAAGYYLPEFHLDDEPLTSAALDQCSDNESVRHFLQEILDEDAAKRHRHAHPNVAALQSVKYQPTYGYPSGVL